MDLERKLDCYKENDEKCLVCSLAIKFMNTITHIIRITKNNSPIVNFTLEMYRKTIVNIYGEQIWEKILERAEKVAMLKFAENISKN